jgi:hypothetical protein
MEKHEIGMSDLDSNYLLIVDLTPFNFINIIENKSK